MWKKETKILLQFQMYFFPKTGMSLNTHTNVCLFTT